MVKSSAGQPAGRLVAMSIAGTRLYKSEYANEILRSTQDDGFSVPKDFAVLLVNPLPGCVFALAGYNHKNLQLIEDRCGCIIVIRMKR